jgi:hypothetical protein
MWLVVAVFVWRAVIVIPHTHPDGVFQARCPACHTDGAVSQVAAFAPAAGLVAAPIPIGFLVPTRPATPPADVVESALPARGPPLSS